MQRKTDKNIFFDYLTDCSILPPGNAREIVFPETEKEIQHILKEADTKKIKVTISGAGTGVVGARIPEDGMILATDRLNRIIEIKQEKDKGNSTAIVEPGVSIKALNEYLKPYGLKYLPDPTEKNAFIGGTVSTNASGAQGFKYGQTREHIIGLRLIFANGECFQLKRGQYIISEDLKINVSGMAEAFFSLPDLNLPKVKNAAGYCFGRGTDLIDLFIGQEGTLAVISRVEIKLAKLPKDILSAIIYFDKEEDALSFAEKLREISRDKKNKQHIDAACIEYFDKNSLRIVGEAFSFVPRDKKAAIYFEQNIYSEEYEDILIAYAGLLEDSGAGENDIWFAKSRKDRERIEQIRYELPVRINEQVRKNGFSKIGTDIAVSDLNFPEMFAVYRSALCHSGIPYCIFGHIGENHLHVNLMPENPNDHLKAKEIYLLFIKKALSLGGTVSAEHGIGKLKREYFKLMVGETALKNMALLKMKLDPNLTLCPGNIFDPEIFNCL